MKRNDHEAISDHRYTMVLVADWGGEWKSRKSVNLAASSKEEACKKARRLYGNTPGYVGAVSCRQTS
jgi:hypothetical protein